MDKTLILVRGVPGCGKSTLAAKIADVVFAADDYFINANGEYKFDGSQIKLAHAWCLNQTRQSIVNGVDTIAVANTFTQEWEMESYIDLANMYGYMVHTIIVENRHGGENIHGVPADKVDVMRKRFQVKL